MYVCMSCVCISLLLQMRMQLEGYGMCEKKRIISALNVAIDDVALVGCGSNGDDARRLIACHSRRFEQNLAFVAFILYDAYVCI